MKYTGTPQGLWMMFAGSFRKQLSIVFGYEQADAKRITKNAKATYQKIIKKLPEFEKDDRFQMNIVIQQLLIKESIL